MLGCFRLILLLIFNIIVCESGHDELFRKTLHVPAETPLFNRNTMIINADSEQDNARVKRSSEPEGKSGNNNITVKLNYLNDSHKQLMVHWVGNDSDVIICLARDPAQIYITSSSSKLLEPSAIYISYDYGNSYENKTNLFALPNGIISSVEKFFNHPRNNSKFIFTDVQNKFMFLATDFGRKIEGVKLNFTPHDVSFHDYEQNVFLVLDKSRPKHDLWLTDDFGKTWRLLKQYVKSYFWFENDLGEQELIIQRAEPDNYSVIVRYNYKTEQSEIFATEIKEFYMKGDYFFFTKTSTHKNEDLYVSYKLQKPRLCVFDTALDRRAYFVADVTDGRAFVAIGHSDIVSHLYVSENLENNRLNHLENVNFVLSLENILCYFPNTTWIDSWLHHITEEAFADLYKVEGISGIYIVSQIAVQVSANLGPQHLVSRISFNHGGTWHPLSVPEFDNEGQPTACEPANNCSLHLSQRFSQLYPDTKSITILSSKWAPGVIIATGVIGKSLKGHFGIYISTDAGLTWRQALKELYFFNMADYGGVLAAVKYFKKNGETRHILYSTDVGNNWKKAQFHSEHIKLYGLMTQPGENTTVFTMFGSALDEHKWIIVKLDMKNVFNYTCTSDDYKDWLPSQKTDSGLYIPCVLGETQVYKRKQPKSNCYSGKFFGNSLVRQRCFCHAFDYECDVGFISTGNPPHCIRNKTTTIDPYRVPPVCLPGEFYSRTKGYRKIVGDVCVGGYESHYLPDKIPCPYKKVPEFLLFAQRERIARYNLNTKKIEELPIQDIKNVVAVEFDMHENCVYWSDVIKDTISRQCLENGTTKEILVSNDLSSVEGMALDWISHTLYFVDGIKARIELIKTNVHYGGRMRRTILSEKVLKQPRGIAVDPVHGYLFWTDWAQTNPSVNRADLDGKNVKQLFKSPTVEWPNGITIDYIQSRIYWIDASKDFIASSDFQGERMKIVIQKKNFITHPFAIAVFKDTMYWDDWNESSIFSADKDNGMEVSLLAKNLSGLMNLKIYAHSLQEGTNACTNTTWEYICVGTPTGNSFLCPDGMVHKDGKCLCPGDLPPYKNMTCPKKESSCASKYFTCGIGLCIPKLWRCDGDDDCGDGSDEQYCDSQVCSKEFFACPNGRCIPQHWRCDNEADCVNRTDEIACNHNVSCKSTELTCENGQCVSLRFKCDGENDCVDGTDERDCLKSQPTNCTGDEFHCNGGAITCIPNTWKCDGEHDCTDGSDEINCLNNTCEDFQFSCGPPSYRCIYATYVCDGDKDCIDGRDEKMNCTTPSPLPELINPFNKTTDKNCQSWMFKCASGTCIPIWWKCDSSDDCGDGSDEIGCKKPTPVTTTSPNPELELFTCKQNQFLCMDGECIPLSWACDGGVDCRTGEDEANCFDSHRCESSEFVCRMDGSCVPGYKLCDGVQDCPDASDEISCHALDTIPDAKPENPSCAVGYYSCDTNECHPLSTLCDGNQDCHNNYDEANCTGKNRIYQVLQMGVDERNINESSLLMYWWIPIPDKTKLEYLPSISKLGEDSFKNQTWISRTAFVFTNLETYTFYNMTVYVRLNNSKTVFPPAKYFVAQTGEGIPSEPWNVTVQQRNGSHVLISWNKPKTPNGIITNYEISWYPPLPPTKLKLTDNSTAHLLAAEFQPLTNYSFYVVAYNKAYESKISKVKSIVFDAESDITRVTNLEAVSETENNITLKWRYEKPVDGFIVTVSAGLPYPSTLPRLTYSTNITVTNLAPGVPYKFEVRAFKKTFIGPGSSLVGTTSGIPLSVINVIDAKVASNVGTSVNITWEPPKDHRKVNWVYGIYYGVTANETVQTPRYNTTNLTAVISNLEACEQYIIAVGIVGPLGSGPVSLSHEVLTMFHKTAPPKKLMVIKGVQNPLALSIMWSASCDQIREPIGYIINIQEKVMKKNLYITIDNTNNTELSHTAYGTYGGVYEIRVSTNVPNATFTSPFTYIAPPILPPIEFEVFATDNGSYGLSWLDKFPDQGGPYSYELMVSEGNALNEKAAQTIQVHHPPIYYTNTTSQTYSFAVRIVSEVGYKSELSTVESRRHALAVEASAISETSFVAIIVPIVVLLLVLGGALTVFYVRYRNLQNRFTRFGNPHYDSRSEAATFDDDTLQEDDGPQIQGFSQDEPLVIA